MYRKTMLITLLCSALLIPSRAAIASRSSRDLIVVEPGALPELVRAQAQAMMLRQLGNGETFLYLEQQQLARIVILNVTDPGHIEIVACSTLDTSVPFDFINPVGDSAIFIRFRGNVGSAILDLRNPKAPSLRDPDLLKKAMYKEPLGDTAFTIIDEATPESVVVAHDTQVIGASDPRSPHLLATIRLVPQKIEKGVTSTVFFLGADGLTALRLPHLEEEYRVLTTSDREDQ